MATGTYMNVYEKKVLVNMNLNKGVKREFY
jgi:hypothetical protein